MQKTALYLKDIGKTFYLAKGMTDVPTPSPKSVIIKVKAAGINPVDAKLALSGHHLWKFPHISGLDGAGEVVQTGEEVTLVKIGDQVAWHSDLVHGGGFSTHIELPEHILFAIPSAIDSVVAASIPCAGLTAWLALMHRMQLTPDMNILIEAGAGGVGGFAIQIAKMLGLTVLTTASPQNREYVLGLGADHVFNYKHPQLTNKILQATGNKKLDAVLDSIGHSASPRNISLLKHEGQYASLLGMPHAEDTDIFTVAPTVYIIALGGAHTSGDYESQCRLAKMGSDMLAAIEKGTITSLPITEVPFVDTTVTQAMHRQLEGHVTGKQVIVIE